MEQTGPNSICPPVAPSVKQVALEGAPTIEVALAWHETGYRRPAVERRSLSRVIERRDEWNRYIPRVDQGGLAKLEHENLIEAIAVATASAERSLVRHAGGVALIVSGLPARIFNQILIESDDAERATVEEAVAITRGRGDRFVVNLRVGADDRFAPLMADLGLVPISDTPWMPGMALYPIHDAEAPSLPGHEIVRVTREEQLEDHIQATVAGFEMSASMVRDIVTPALLQRRGVSLYTGYTNGQPVSTGVGVRTGQTMGLYDISTVPEARGRGYGAAVTRRVADDGREEGCDVAALQASRMGFPVYERLGYRTVVEYMGYIDPPTSALNASANSAGESSSAASPQ
ncbi:MAG TPA: GNAT family N-acetyltransferase [Candidatus Limnocylindrales bacterium]